MRHLPSHGTLVVLLALAHLCRPLGTVQRFAALPSGATTRMGVPKGVAEGLRELSWFDPGRTRKLRHVGGSPMRFAKTQVNAVTAPKEHMDAHAAVAAMA